MPAIADELSTPVHGPHRHRHPPVRRRLRPTPARLLAAVAALGLLLGIGLTLAGAATVGVSTDEPVHQSRTNVWFETGWYVPQRFLDAHGDPKPTVAPGRLHAYGASYSVYGHAVAVAAGAEQWGTTERTAAAYTARGIAVALLAIAAALAVGFATAVTAGRRLAGLWAAAAAMALPLWAGYGMFAVKDIPAATGWTLVTAGLVVALHRSPGRWRWLAISGLCAVGVWFSVGVRTALWVPLTVALVCFGVLAAARWRAVRGNVLAAVVGLAAGLAAVAALHYRSAATPVTWLLSAVRTSGDFHWNGTTLTAGRLVTEKPPWWYLPAWLGGSMPLLLGALAAAGIVAAVVALIRGGGQAGGARSAGSQGGSSQNGSGQGGSGLGGAVRRRLLTGGAVMSLWGIQALLLPVVATLGGATMYAGLRQHLYTLPALAALAGFAAARLLRARLPQMRLPRVGLPRVGLPRARLPRPRRGPVRPVAAPLRSGGWLGPAAVCTVLALALAAPLAAQVQLFPYQYVFKNTLAGPVNGRWEADMHLVSGREALTRVPVGAEAWCYTRPRHPIRVRQCAEQRQMSPFATEQGRRATTGAEPETVWVIGRTYRGGTPPPACVDAGSVTRRLHGERVVLTYVVRCPPTILDQSDQ